MCRKIRYDGESWKLFTFWRELNKAQVQLSIALPHCAARGAWRRKPYTNAWPQGPGTRAAVHFAVLKGAAASNSD